MNGVEIAILAICGVVVFACLGSLTANYVCRLFRGWRTKRLMDKAGLLVYVDPIWWSHYSSHYLLFDYPCWTNYRVYPPHTVFMIPPQDVDVLLAKITRLRMQGTLCIERHNEKEVSLHVKTYK